MLSRDIFSCEPKYERSQSGANDFQDAHARELAACLPPRVVPHAPASERAWVCTACLCAYEAFNDGYGSPRSVGRAPAEVFESASCAVCGYSVGTRHDGSREPGSAGGGSGAAVRAAGGAARPAGVRRTRRGPGRYISGPLSFPARAPGRAGGAGRARGGALYPFDRSRNFR